MTIETFSMDAELAPFLRGEFLIFDMRLVRPKGAIDIAADGTVDWAVRPSTPFDAARDQPREADGHRRPDRHPPRGERAHASLSEINTQSRRESLAGPWRIGGTLRLDGMPMRVRVSTGKVDATAPCGCGSGRPGAGYPVVVEADGNIRLDNGAADLFRPLQARPSEPTRRRRRPEAAIGGAGLPPQRQVHARPPAAVGRRVPVRDRAARQPLFGRRHGLVELGNEPRFALEAGRRADALRRGGRRARKRPAA